MEDARLHEVAAIALSTTPYPPADGEGTTTTVAPLSPRARVRASIDAITAASSQISYKNARATATHLPAQLRTTATQLPLKARTTAAQLQAASTNQLSILSAQASHRASQIKPALKHAILTKEEQRERAAVLWNRVHPPTLPALDKVTLHREPGELLGIQMEPAEDVERRLAKEAVAAGPPAPTWFESIWWERSGGSEGGAALWSPKQPPAAKGEWVVTHVTPGGVADRSKRLRSGDRLLSINGHELRLTSANGKEGDLHAFAAMLAPHVIHDTVELVVARRQAVSGRMWSEAAHTNYARKLRQVEAAAAGGLGPLAAVAALRRGESLASVSDVRVSRPSSARSSSTGGSPGASRPSSARTPLIDLALRPGSARLPTATRLPAVALSGVWRPGSAR